MKRREIAEKRTANTKIFENQDHSMTAEIYLDAVHYQEEDGSWQEMDDSLSEEASEEAAAQDASGKAPKDFVNKKGRLKIRFKNQAKEQGTVTVSKDGGELTWGMEGAQKTRASRYGADGKQILYPGVLPGVDLRCRVTGEKVKEDLVLASPDVPGSFAFLYKLKKLHAVQGNNRVSFLDEEENEKFTVSAPYMKDAAGERSEAIKVSLSPDKQGRCRIIFQADEKWLTAPERKYPVVVDPVTTTSLKLSDIQDAYVNSRNEEDNYSDNYNRIRGGDEIYRSFLKFMLPDIHTGDMVINAKLVLVSTANDGAERTVQVHKVLQDWLSNKINWYNKPIYEETIQDLCKFKGDTPKYVTLDITRLVKDWYQDGNNFGLMLKEEYEISGVETRFLSCNDVLDDDKILRPKIEVSYVNYSGLEDYWTYHSQSVGRAGTVHVNDYNGNLILVRPTLVLGGSRMPVSLNHVYNSNDRDVNLGYGNGFRLNYHQTIKKVTIGTTDYYQHTDGDGTVHYFYYDSEKKVWKDESGLDFTLTVNSGAAEAFVIKDKEDNELVFTSSGYLVKVRDKNGKTLAITYGSGRITKITDGAGRVTTLTYLKDSAGKATDLSQVKTPSGQTITFAYTANGTMTNLTSVTDVDGAKVTYTFDSRGNLASAANVDGYQVKYSYYGTSPYRVKTITEYGGGTAGNSLSLTYGYNSTKFTDNKGRAEIYRFNNSGNLIHIHDGFGHAASGKYNTTGGHVNRLENETKLQSNIVQLLKDPIIQAGTLGWSGKVYAADTGETVIDSTGANCKVGNRSLKAKCTDVTSYAYWAQNVTVKKGETYTASMYVKATVTKTAADGGCILRIRYLDKDGVQHLLDSEVLKTTTKDFVLLKRTFTLPVDASSDSIKIYMVVWHAEGTMYGDMAQLEIGDTANRCNLVANGEFHRGSTVGFSKAGRIEDGLTSIGEESLVPMQIVGMGSGALGTIYASASASGTQVATVTKGQHLATSAACRASDGTIWYRVKNVAGQWGYISSGGIVPYLGGSDCTETGVVGVTGAVLRATASDTGTPVEELIPKGTNLGIVAHKTSGNKKWYYVGMQIDTKRYMGYIPAEQVILLCRNNAIVKMKTADTYYQKPAVNSVAVGNTGDKDEICVRGVLVKDNGEKWYAVQSGMEFVFLSSTNTEIVTAPITGKNIYTKVEEAVGGLEEHIYRFIGDPSMNKKLTKTLDLTGKKGDTYMVNAWGYGTPLPETNNDKARRFGVEVIFVGPDGTNDVHYTNFSPDIMDWQFLSDVYVAKKDYTSIKVSYTYCHNANIAFFDGLSLFREEFGQTYTYDENDNLVSVTDAQKTATEFEYNGSNDLTGISHAKGKKFTYEYDSKHNVTKGTSAQGLIYRIGYDSVGNITESACVEPGNEGVGTWVRRTMTGDKNHVASVTDSRNQKVQYTWDANRDLLTAMTDARGSKLTYEYDTASRLKSVSQSVTQGGTLKTVKNTYTYAKDRLTGISHNGFSYGFSYDAFGNTLDASIADIQAVAYEYEAKNGNLKKMTYGNGAYIRYTYDDQDRLLLSYYKDASGTEQKLNGYVYDRMGNLSQVTNHVSGKTYELAYDLLDRLMRARDNEGNYYEYTYDADNNMTRMYHGAGTSGIGTDYTYDKDGREIKAAASKNYYRTTSYDSLGRVDIQTWTNTGTPYSVIYEYADTDSTRRSGLPSAIRCGERLISYTYDGNGNITKIMESDTAAQGGTTKTITYQYDELNQLIRENNQVLNKTVTYEYDLGGNMVSVKEYGYTTAASITGNPTKTETGTYDTAWKDKLLSWGGTSMTYDAIGNMLTKGAVKYTWTQGRKLSAVDNGKKIQYFYDHTGNRTRKVVDGVTTQFRMAGDLLVSERTGTEKNLWYRYDAAGNVIAVTYDSVFYTYVRNVQNDIIAMIDSKGKEVVRYTYDSWGKVVSITGDMAESLGKRNPFRYRGYYYDTETGMYYLKSRYYDPELRRFINADDISVLAVSPMELTNKNLYIYCDNNPDVRKDPNGQLWTAIFSGLVGAAVNVVSCGIAAKVTGQSYTGRDIFWAAVSGVASAWNPYAGGVVSAAYAGVTAWKAGGSALEVAVSASAAFVGTTGIGNLSGIIGGKTLETTISASCGATFGTGGNLISAATNAGVNKTRPAESKGTMGGMNIVKPTGYRCIGQGRTYNGKTGVTTNYKIYKSDTGLIFKMFI